MRPGARLCGKVLLAGVVACFAFAANVANANTIVLELPTNWRLENYPSSHEVHLWFTGASECTNGHIYFSGASADDMNRLWAIVTTAKIANRKVGLQYTGTAGACTIISFFMDQ